MTLALHLRITGALLLGLAAAHVAFPRRLHWKEELARLSPLNRQIFLVHCLFIVLMLVMMGGMMFMMRMMMRGMCQGPNDAAASDRSPLDVAKERLAKGEITKEEFDSIRGDLA